MSELGGAEFNSKSENPSTKLPDYEATLKLTNPDTLLDKWETTRPWEPKAPGARTKMWNRMTMKSRLNAPIPEIYFVVNPQPGEEDKIRAGGNRRDVRGWILREIGISDEMINNPPLDPLEAQKLIAKGLGISHFHAALLDHATRNTREEDADENFRQALTHPELFASEKVASFAKHLENLDKQSWERAHTVESPIRINQLGLEKDEKWIEENGENDAVYQRALVDIATAALEAKFGKKDPPESDVLRTVRVLGMEIQQGKVVSADIAHAADVHEAINEAGGTTSKTEVDKILGDLAETSANERGDLDAWERQFEDPSDK